MENIKFRPLGEARTIVEGIGLDITHVHDDLIFVEHNAFLLQFDDECEYNLFLHYNEDCDPAEKENIISKLSQSAKGVGFTVTKAKTYKISQKEETEELVLEFF
jgi:hypothetical protein